MAQAEGEFDVVQPEFLHPSSSPDMQKKDSAPILSALNTTQHPNPDPVINVDQQPP